MTGPQGRPREGAMRALVAERVARPAKSVPVQAKLRVGAVDDPLEREADDVADQVMQSPAPTAPRLQRCPGGCPGDDELGPEPFVQRFADGRSGTAVSVEPRIRSLRGGGQPLSPAERAFFEPRFGHDFSGVRLHTDTRAAGLAEALNARAFTCRRDVVFAHGQYPPGVEAGRKLLAHELAHVVQQQAAPRSAGTGTLRPSRACCPHVVQRQPHEEADETEAAAVWETPAVDALAAGPVPPDPEEPYGPASLVEDLYFAILNLHAALRETLAAGGRVTEEHQRLTAAVADTRSWMLAGFPMAVAEELASGLLLVGDLDGADRVWQAAHAAGNPPHERSDVAARAEFYRRIVGTWEVPPDDPVAALDRAGAIVQAIEAMGAQHATLRDIGELDKERARGIVAAQIQVLVLFFIHVQVVIDHIIAATHPDPDGALGVLESLLNAAGEACKPIWREDVAIITADFASDPAVLKDFFQPEEKGRQVPVGFYGEQPEAGSPAEGLHVEVGTAVETRQHQVQVLRGLAKQDGSGMVSVGGAEVHAFSSDDALRVWTRQRFDVLKDETGDEAAALAQLVQDLEAYFKAFTVSSKQNIGERSAPFINADFPRAATGELIHDCGVYAMRVMYALSLLPGDLGLKFYLVRLPVHVAVVITGRAALRVQDPGEAPVTGAEVPLFVVHNGVFTRAKNEPAGPDLERNIGGFAAGTFIPTSIDPNLIDQRKEQERQPGSVDVPFRVQPVPDPGQQRQLQQAYQRLWRVIPESEDEQGVVEESFIELLEAYRRFHNDGLRPLSQLFCDGWAEIERSPEPLEASLGRHLYATARSWDNVDAQLEAFRVASNQLQTALQAPSFRATWETMMARAEELTFYDWMAHYKACADRSGLLWETLFQLQSALPSRRISDEAAEEQLRMDGCRPLDPIR
jgi:Domain of unknown function (DUF4157)